MHLDRPSDGNGDMIIASETQNTPEKLIPIHRSAERQVSPTFVTNRVRESPVRPQSASHTSHTILLMGEDPLMLRALTRLLRKAGYTVVTHEACSAIPEPQALEVAQARMIVVDVPDDWRERGLKQVDDLVTPNDGQSILWIGNSGEAEAYGPFHLIKPFSGSQFLSAIEVTLNSLSLTSGGSEVYGAKSGELDKSAN
jgi:CheY-like chemotaxis protein